MRFNIETTEYQTDKDNIPHIFLFCRDENGKQKIWHVRCETLNLRPRFYVPTTEIVPDQEGIILVVPEPKRGIYGTVLKKVITRIPANVGSLRGNFQHHSADIRFTDVFLNEADFYIGIESKGMDLYPSEPLPMLPLLFYVDLEVAAPHEEFPNYLRAKWPVVLITTWNSYTNRVVCFLWHPDLVPGSIALPEDLQTPSEYTIIPKFVEPLVKLLERDPYTKWKPEGIEIRWFDNEKIMHQRFIGYMNEVIKPGVWTGYNIWFDAGYEIGRLRYLKMNPNLLSPLKEAYVRSEFDVVVKGFDMFDGHQAFKDYFTMNYGELPSWKFAEVIQHEKVFGKPKVGFWKGGEIRAIWKNKDLAELLRYGIDDANDFAAMMKKYEIVEFSNTIRVLAGCSLSDALSFFKAWDVMMLRDDEYILPSGRYTKKFEEATGPIVFMPKVGIHENVGQIDVRSTYVNLIVEYNIGPDTLDPNGENAIEIELFGKKKVLRFRQDPPGILKRNILKVEAAREKVRQEMEKYPEKSDIWQLLWTKQFALKFLTSSLPGLLGNEAFRLFNQELHAAVMQPGARITIRCSTVAEEEGIETLYGDTDSVFLDTKTKERSLELVDKTNVVLAREFGEAFQVKLDEFWQSVFFLQKRDEPKGKKKFYVGIREDGSMKTVGLRASNMADVTLRLFDQIFYTLLKERDIPKAKRIVRELRKRFDNLPIEDICIPIGMTKDPENYGLRNPDGTYKVDSKGRRKGLHPHIRGALYAKKYLKIPLGTGSKMKYIYLKGVQDNSAFEGKPRKYPRTNVISFEHVSQVPWKVFIPDRDKMFEKTVLDKVADVFLSIGVDFAELFQGTKQSKLMN